MSDKLKSNQPDRSYEEESETDKNMATFMDKTDRSRPRQQHVDVTAMIRSLQRTEGLTDCFRTGLADCDQLDCAWRQYCLEKSNKMPSAK